MAQRPYVLLSVATSLDGCLDDTTDTRLLLSNEADLDRVDEVRAGSDAIMVGAGTIRRDNPALLVRSRSRRASRVKRGLPASPARATVTVTGDLDPAARFFTEGESARLVYVPEAVRGRIARRLGGAAVDVEIVGVPAPDSLPRFGGPGPVSLAAVLADLAGRGVHRLMVEGGGSVLAQFLAKGLADELNLAIAPLFVGDPAAPRIAGRPPGNLRMHLAETRLIGDVVLLRYLPGGPGMAHTM